MGRERPLAEANSPRGFCYTGGMARKTRIGVSVFFGLLTVAFVVLWVRSYAAEELISRTSVSGRVMTMGTNGGCIYFVTRKHSLPATSGFFSSFRWRSHGWTYARFRPAKARASFVWGGIDGPTRIQAPILPMIFLTAIGIYVPCYRWHFSLRDLLITTALVAVVLGVATGIR